MSWNVGPYDNSQQDDTPIPDHSWLQFVPGTDDVLPIEAGTVMSQDWATEILRDGEVAPQ